MKTIEEIKARKSAYNKKRYLAKREELKEKAREYHIANRDKVLARGLVYRQKHRAELSAKSGEYHRANRKKCLARQKRYHAKNKDKARTYWRDYMRRRLRDDPNFRLKHALRRRVYMAFASGVKRSKSTVDLLGCSIGDLWLYLESKFEPGMTRENYGKVWHVDHIMPCAIFDLTKLEHQKRCFHFSNLQPMFASENHSKNDTVITNQFNLL